EGVEELGAVRDDAAVLLVGAGEEAGDIDERAQRDVEAVAEADEARRLDAGLDVEAAGEDLGLVRDDADGAAADAGEADDDVLRVTLVDLEQVAFVDHGAHDVAD